MSETPRVGEAAADYGRPSDENAFLGFLRQPRITLILLASWEIVAVLVEFAASNAYSLDLSGGIDGLLAGRLLSWQAVPIAVLYFYCARDPERYPRIFWFALIEQGAAIGANLYHLAANHLEFEAIFINIAVSAFLGALVFLNIFRARDSDAARVRSG